MRLIQSYNPAYDEEIPALYEDEDGIRLLIVRDMEDLLGGGLIKKACHDGAAHVWVSDEELQCLLPLDSFPWHEAFAPMTYAELLKDVPEQKPGNFVHLHTHSEYCLAPKTRVATADLRWVNAEDIRKGDELVGFGEELRGDKSRMERSVVRGVKQTIQPCYKITMEDGRSIIASSLHGWVGVGSKGSTDYPNGPTRRYGGNGRRWICTEDIIPGKTKIVDWAAPWEELSINHIREAGWLAGIADGEAWLHNGQFGFGQNPGLVLNEMKRVCDSLGYTITKDTVQNSNGSCIQFRIAGYAAALKFMSQCRPERFSNRTDELWVGRKPGSKYTPPVLVVGLEYLGRINTIAIETSTKTLVAEGFLSHNSSLDGLSTVQEIVDRVVADGQPAIAITDHGTCASHPMLQTVAKKAGIKPIFGIEAYFVDDRFRRPIGLDGKKKTDLSPTELEAYEKDNAEVRDYWHLILWAENDIGLHNLWAISTEANRDGYYRHPRMDWDTLTKYSEGVMCSTACLRGPICHPLLRDDSERAVVNLARLQAIFPDSLYMEIHTNNEPDQIKVNPQLIAMANTAGIPTIAVSDSHYSCCEHEKAHKVWIAAQTGQNINDDSALFSGDSPYHLMTEDEVRKALSYLDSSDVEAAISNTVAVADRCSAELKGDPTPPIFSAEGGVEADFELLMSTCMDNWHKTGGKARTQVEYQDRFVMEMQLLVEKNFCGYFLMVSDYCLWAKHKGILLGPGRGSGGGSLVAYLSGITEIDPVETDLLFERFMTKGRTELPDFDIDFPSSRIEEVLEYISNKWGANSVVRIGTHMRLKNKGVIRKLATTLKGSIDIDWSDIEAMSKLIEKAESSSAGLGISWDELWSEYATELAPYRAKYPLLFEYADIFVGRLNAYGKHAAGVIISPGNDLTSMLPLRVGEDGRLISEYDMDAIASLGLVKFDFLAVTTLDTLQMCVDLVRERTGKVIDLYGWRDEYLDQEVWKFLSDGNTKGCFQIETPAGTKITKELKPQNIHDLADVITLDRPGPMRSGLDRSYLKRRHGQEKITYADPRLAEVLDRSYGVLLYQEDIMKTCMVLAGYDGEESDKVRKILGKKKVEAAKEEGLKFLPAVIERGMEEAAAKLLWQQMEEFSRYSFNRAHAYGYALLAFWCGALKYWYPQEFYVAVMSTLDSSTKNKIGNFVMEARKRGHDVLPPDVNDSGDGFNIVGDNIRFGLKSINGIGDVAVAKIIENQPYASFADFRERSGSNLGVVKKLIRVGAFDSFGANRRVLELEIEREESGELDRCVNWNGHKTGAPNDLPCEFDWSSEPVSIGARGKPLKQKAIPKKCTVRCRNYVKAELQPIEDAEPYSDADVRKIEMELLGVHLSSTPFDVANERWGDAITTASQADAEDRFESRGILAIVQKVTEKMDKNHNVFAIVSLFAQDGVLDALCFNKNWKELKNVIKEDRLVLTVLSKNDRGYQMSDAALAESIG